MEPGVASLVVSDRGGHPDGHIHWADDDTWYAIYTVNPDSSDLTRLGHGYEPEWSPDGTKIAFSYQSEIWIMDADGSDRTQVTTTGGQDPAWSPNGDELVFVGPDFERDLMVINTDGTDLRTIHTDGCDFAPDWSPSGTESGLLALGTGVKPGVEVMDAVLVVLETAVLVGISGVGIGVPASGNSSDAQPTIPIVATVAAILPVINANRLINSRRESNPSR